MKKPEFSCAILSKLNLDDIKKVVKEFYLHKDGPGRAAKETKGTGKLNILEET
jgi:hypothetical protein